MLVSRFLLARHGQTNWNAEGRIQGTLDTSVLTLNGVQQVSGLGYWLAAQSEELPLVDRTWCSPLMRARQSLAAVAGAAAASGQPLPEHRIYDDLREIELHQWEGRLKEEIAASDGEAWTMWKGQPHLYETPGGAWPLLDLWSRSQANWDALRKEPAGLTFVMAHGALGRCMLGTALGLPPASFRDPVYDFVNAACVEIEWEEGEPAATRWRSRYPAASDWQSAEAAQERQREIEERGGIILEGASGLF
tara:strand:- start:58 stop:804 length:747 start_codon:yes stop_codon:yes gene_type:complete